MALLFACLVMLVAATIAFGMAAYRLRWRLFGGPTAWGQAASRRFGRVPATLGIMIVGWAATAAVGLGLGLLAKGLQPHLDVPVFNWVHSHVHGGLFTRLNAKFTMIGNSPIVEVIAFLATMVLVFAYRGRRPWLPLVTMLVALWSMKLIKKFAAAVVHRGHPPTSFGTYPSGGVVRILAIYGAVVLLVIVLAPWLSRAWRAGLWTGLAAAAVIEAFSRLTLSKQWFTDSLFGLPFGALLLLTTIACVAAVTTPESETGPPAWEPREYSQDGAAPTPREPLFQ